MQFNSDGICILESIQHPDECDAYIWFLKNERMRHAEAMVEASHAAGSSKFYVDVDVNTIYHKAEAAFYDSAANRHQQDIDGIARRIEQIQVHRETLK